jgi:hypothetical protein
MWKQEGQLVGDDVVECGGVGRGEMRWLNMNSFTHI